MRDEPNVLLKCPKKIQRHHKGCIFILTAGQWSWKSKSAKECVTTHLPNENAPKMDGAQIFYLYNTFVRANLRQRVGGREENDKISI